MGDAGNLLREREHYIALLQAELARARADHLHLLEKHDASQKELHRSNAWALSLDRELAEARTRLHESQRDAEEKAKWAQSLDRQLEEKSIELATIVGKLEEMHRELVARTEWAREQEALYGERTEWALRLDKELSEARALVDERTAWALRLDAELMDHSSVGNMLRTELQSLMERTAKLAGNEANLEQLANQLREENRTLREQLRRRTESFEETQGRLAAIGDIANRLSHERELVKASKWLRLGRLLHLGPRLAEDSPPI